MSEKKVCPWRCEARLLAGIKAEWWEGVGSDVAMVEAYKRSHADPRKIELTEGAECIEGDCAKWGLIERGAMTLVNSVYEPAPDIYGCTRS